jgi:hypothetical protein
MGGFPFFWSSACRVHGIEETILHFWSVLEDVKEKIKLFYYKPINHFFADFADFLRTYFFSGGVLPSSHFFCFIPSLPWRPVSSLLEERWKGKTLLPGSSLKLWRSLKLWP